MSASTILIIIQLSIEAMKILKAKKKGEGLDAADLESLSQRAIMNFGARGDVMDEIRSIIPDIKDIVENLHDILD